MIIIYEWFGNFIINRIKKAKSIDLVIKWFNIGMQYDHFLINLKGIYLFGEIVEKFKK